jgi:hypothetical protein
MINHGIIFKEIIVAETSIMQGTYICSVKPYECLTEKWFIPLFQEMAYPLGHSSKTEMFTEEHVYREGSRPTLRQAAKDGNRHLVETLINSRVEIKCQRWRMYGVVLRGPRRKETVFELLMNKVLMWTSGIHKVILRFSIVWRKEEMWT